MKTDIINYQELANDVLRALAREREQLIEKVEKKNAMLEVMESFRDMLQEFQSMKEENERLCDCLAKKKATFPEVHNHFEAGSSNQVFNDKVYRGN